MTNPVMAKNATSEIESIYEAYEEAWQSLPRYSRIYIEILGIGLPKLLYDRYKILEQLREEYGDY